VGAACSQIKDIFATLLDGGNDTTKVYRQKKLPIRRNVAGLVILVQLYTKLYKIVRRLLWAALGVGRIDRIPRRPITI
jgi:hypothetical protein